MLILFTCPKIGYRGAKIRINSEIKRFHTKKSLLATYNIVI
jgi:hypothetical protein